MTRPWFLTFCIALVGSSCTVGVEDEQEVAVSTRVDDRGRVVLSVEERTALGLETEIVETGSLTTGTLRFGKVIGRPQEDALVVAPVTGRLLAPTLTLGARVSPGDLLVTLEPLVDAASRATLEAQRQELQGQIEGARAQVEAKRTELNRVSTLVISGLATEAERAQAQAALTAEQARVESLKRAGSELDHMTGGHLELRTPVPGIVAALATDTGSLVQQGTILARVVRTGPRWVEIAVPPEDPVGSRYRVHGGPDFATAVLLTRGVVIQPDGTRRDRLEAAADAVVHLLPGATVPVEVLHETKGLLVPSDALVRRGREMLVFIESEAGRFEARRVELAARDDTRIVVTSGLSTGDRVVTRGASALLGELGTMEEPRERGGPE